MSEKELRELAHRLRATDAADELVGRVNDLLSEGGDALSALLDELTALRGKLAEAEERETELLAKAELANADKEAYRELFDRASSRLLPPVLTPKQKSMVNDALTEWLMDPHFMADHADRFHSILTRIEGET